MIRQASLPDLAGLTHVAESTGMFLGGELSAFSEEMRQHLSPGAQGRGTLLVAMDGDGEGAAIAGAAYFAPEVMAQGVMNLLFIGVLPAAQRRRIGSMLLNRFEEAARQGHARLAIIETASAEMFAPAWGLYRRHGYDEEARVRDYYDDNLDKLIFRKRL